MKLPDKRILITGGSRGIGRCIAQRALAEGAAQIVICSEEAVPPDWEEFERTGKAQFVQADLCTEDGPGNAVRRAKEIMGGLDGLVHCAGVYIEDSPGDRSPVEIWNFTVNIKARGGYLLATEFVNCAEPGAAFVGITSINAEQSEPDHLAYDPACAALGGVVRAFAVHYAPQYRFNALAPGLIRTRLTEAVAADPQLHQFACDNIPLARMGKPEDCAGAAVFLLSEDASYITGETLFVDGGIRANQMSKPPAG